MAGKVHDPDRVRRFRDAALPLLDEAYTLARYLMRNAADAEDSVQECYLRALRHFDTLRGAAVRPWLFEILRNVCRATHARRALVCGDPDDGDVPLWSEVPETPELQVLRRHDDALIRALVEALPTAFREVLVLREVHDLSYREIATIVGAPIGTVMSRLARARQMLRAAWIAAEEKQR